MGEWKNISIHKALASLDVIERINTLPMEIFQSTRLSRASTLPSCQGPQPISKFQSTRLSRASTMRNDLTAALQVISIHKALASLDLTGGKRNGYDHYFNPQGSREPRRIVKSDVIINAIISIHKALASLDGRAVSPMLSITSISIHKALASLDKKVCEDMADLLLFQSTRLSRASTQDRFGLLRRRTHFNPQGSREPRLPSSLTTL